VVYVLRNNFIYGFSPIFVDSGNDLRSKDNGDTQLGGKNRTFSVGKENAVQIASEKEKYFMRFCRH